jgi:hypothetical protein
VSATNLSVRKARTGDFYLVTWRGRTYGTVAQTGLTWDAEYANPITARVLAAGVEFRTRYHAVEWVREQMYQDGVE